MSEEPTDDLPDDVSLDGEVTTVTNLNSDIERVVNRARNNELAFDFVIGDVSDDSVSKNGTRYFQLVDDDAGIQCLAFSNTRESLPEFEEGDRVAVKGRLNYYAAEGQCSIYVNDIVLIGDSHYHREIEQVRQALDDEGLFDEERKQELPAYPTGIGIVTSEGSDAEEDAVNAINSQHPDVDIYLCDSRVQGLAALEELCTAVTFLDAYRAVDIIVVTRGGGSEQDLHAFNTEGVARTIAQAETPVVTAIGHENDRPIVDDVADDRAMTPTDIGSVVVPEKSQLLSDISTQQDRLHTAYQQLTDGQLQRYNEDLTTVYTQFAETTVSTLRNEVGTAYEQHATSSTTQLHSDLDAAYNQFVTERLTTLENDVTAANRAFRQQKHHEEETAELEAQQQRYKLAAIALLVLLLLTGLVVVLFVL